VIGVNTMVAGRLALAIPSNAVRDFLAAGPRSAWLGATVSSRALARANGYNFGLVLLEVEPGSPAAQASLMAGDILLGTEEKPFQSIDDLAKAMDGQGLCLLRLEFLRGNYSRVRRVTCSWECRTTERTESPRDSRFYRRSFAADSRGPAEHVADSRFDIVGSAADLESLSGQFVDVEPDVVLVEALRTLRKSC